MDFKLLFVATAGPDDHDHDDDSRAGGKAISFASDFAGVDMPSFAFGPHGLNLRASHLFASDSSQVRCVANQNSDNTNKLLDTCFILK